MWSRTADDGFLEGGFLLAESGCGLGGGRDGESDSPDAVEVGRRWFVDYKKQRVAESVVGGGGKGFWVSGRREERLIGWYLASSGAALNTPDVKARVFFMGKRGWEMDGWFVSFGLYCPNILFFFF
jgi:hypothetical protein